MSTSASRILIIEDSLTETHVYRRLLEKQGYEVVTATDGEQGIQMAYECQPDLVLMDVVMPGVNGFQATRELQQNQDTAGIPVIIITTKDQDTDRIWGMRQGAVDYMVKPVKKSSLLARVKAALATSESSVS